MKKGNYLCSAYIFRVTKLKKTDYPDDEVEETITLINVRIIYCRQSTICRCFQYSTTLLYFNPRWSIIILFYISRKFSVISCYPHYNLKRTCQITLLGLKVARIIAQSNSIVTFIRIIIRVRYFFK